MYKTSSTCMPIKKCYTGKTHFRPCSTRGYSTCKSKIIFIFYVINPSIYHAFTRWDKLVQETIFPILILFQRFAGFIRKKCINSARLRQIESRWVLYTCFYFSSKFRHRIHPYRRRSSFNPAIINHCAPISNVLRFCMVYFSVSNRAKSSCFMI